MTVVPPPSRGDGTIVLYSVFLPARIPASNAATIRLRA